MAVIWEAYFYGNTIAQWTIALAIIFAFAIGGRILYWILGTTVKTLTSKTKTKLDDIIIDMIEEPILFAIILAGIWYGTSRLVLGESAIGIRNGALMFLVVLNIGWLLARLFDAIFTEYVAPLAEKSDNKLDDQLIPIARKGVKAIIWILAIIIGLNNAGYDVAALIAGLGIGGLALAMAAKDTIANIFGGFTIFMDKPFTIHQRVIVDGFDGNVEEIGLRSTRIRTLDGRLVIIPNSKVVDNPITNITVEPTRKIVLKLGLTYNTSPKQMEKAMKILQDIAKKNKGVDENFKTSFTEFGDFSLGILFIYYIKKDADILATQNSMNMEILTQFNKNKLEFAYPTQFVYTKKA